MSNIPLRDKEFNRIAYVIARHPNMDDRKFVYEIANNFFPEKLHLTVLTGVMEASMAWERLKQFKFDASTSKTDYKEFNFGQYRWLSTIKQHDANYESPIAPRAIYNFINVKFPNDGYVYNPELENDQGQLQVTHDDVKAFVYSFMKNLEATNLFQTKPVIYSSYQSDITEFAIYCVNTEARQILTAKFHHGTPVGRQLNGSVQDWADGLSWKYNVHD